MAESLIDLAGLHVGAEEFLAAVLRATEHPIWVVDPEDVIRFANPAAISALGYDEVDELLGRHSHETIHHSHPDGSPYPASDCPMVLPRSTGETVSRELDWFFRRDGSMFPVSYVCAPIELHDGRGAVVAFTDIDDRLRAEQRLRDHDAALAAQQASLRRVATLVAGGAASEDVFAAIAREVGSVTGLPLVAVWRYGPDDTATVVGVWSDRPHQFQPGTRWPLDGPTITAQVLKTRRPVRIDDWGELPGTIADAARAAGITAAAGVPIVVDGEVWGAMSVDSMDGAPLADDLEDRLLEFTELIAAAFATTARQDELARLADEQAALRRVATMVARDRQAPEVFAAVAEEVGRLLPVENAAMLRYEEDGTALMVASWGVLGDVIVPGMRLPVDGDNVTARVRRTGQPARIDDYATASGSFATRMRELGIGSAVGCPIVVDGRLWGAIIAAQSEHEPLPAGTESRVAGFTELIATAMSNLQARAEVGRLAEEQAALRRVATLVARESSPAEVFAGVVEELASLLGTECVGMLRFDEAEGAAVLLAQSDTPWEPVPLGTRFTLDGENVVTAVFRTEEASRLDDWSNATGSAAAMAQTLGIRSAVGTPIVVEGGLWGTLVAVTRQAEPLPAETEPRMAEFTKLVATAISNAEARGELGRLADEQAALRRVATLVAHEPPPAQVFAAVAEEAGRLLGVEDTTIFRYEDDLTATVVADRGERELPMPVGSTVSLEGDSATALVRRTGRAARVDDFSGATGPLADYTRNAGIGSTVGSPIVVDGRLWGAMIAATRTDEPMPAETESRLTQFTELMATAIANTESHAEVERLGDEQAALRRVATLVAEGASPSSVLDAVAGEMDALLEADQVALNRFEAGDELVVLAHRGLDVERTPVGSRVSIDGESATALVRQSGRPARMEDYASAEGALAELARETGLRSSVSAPISVEGRVWGVITASWKQQEPPPPDTEERMEKFTALVATAIANTDSREAISRLAGEQAALRRVATLVAEDVPPSEVFHAVAREVGTLLGADFAGMARFEDGDVVTVSAWAAVGEFPPFPDRWEMQPGDPATTIAEAGRAARWDDWSDEAGPIAAFLREELGVSSTVGCPVVVEGRVWGALAVHSKQPGPLPPDTEVRVAQFSDLVSTSIANAETRAEVGRLAREQAALRRVATLVVEERPSSEVLAAVADEVGRVLHLEDTRIVRYDADENATVVASWGQLADALPVGTRVSLEAAEGSAVALVFRTARSARIDDFTTAAGSFAASLRELGVQSALAVPIVVEGRLWGALNTASLRPDPIRTDTEARMGQFTELVATAISNIEARAEVAASRARIVAAADDERRRVVRDLHDGAQQRLVHTIITLKLARRAFAAGDDGARLLGDALAQAERATDELRELSHGVLPAVLTRGGLRAGIEALASRMPVPVDIRVSIGRLPATIEATGYFVVAEALTNVAKHSRATRAEVTVCVEDRTLRVRVRDDGVGGAQPGGTGLIGLADRAAALDGQLRVESPEDGGTLIAADIPLPEQALPALLNR